MGLLGRALDISVPAAQEQAAGRADASANQAEIGRGIE
jgi:hypothetical protein